MKLILTAAVDNLGLAGDIVDVKPGYGRNYLLPRGYAITWTKGAEKQIVGIKRARDAREIRGIEHAQQVRVQLEGLSVTLNARAGDTGKLFGAITAADVAQAVKKAGGPTIDKRSVVITKPIKTLGNHTVGVKLHEAVTAHCRSRLPRPSDTHWSHSPLIRSSRVSGRADQDVATREGSGIPGPSLVHLQPWSRRTPTAACPQWPWPDSSRRARIRV